ncbi:MAG: hypothetical protein ACJ8FO_07850, partial [Sphingomicrobium sp.]
MRHLYLVLAVLVILLGLLHAISTLSLFAGFSIRAIWFAGSGLLLILAGAINLLNREYGRDARGLRLTTVGTNVVVTAFAALAGIASHA